MSEERLIIPRERVSCVIDGETHYDHALCLAQLLLDDMAHVNNGRFEDERTVCAFLICSDIFAWAFADSEPVLVQELGPVYEMHMADPVWGVATWIIRKRGERPQPPVEAAMRAAGAWPFADDELRPNTTDAETQALFAHAKALSEQKAAQGDNSDG